jgi:hypothetical protein
VLTTKTQNNQKPNQLQTKTSSLAASTTVDYAFLGTTTNSSEQESIFLQLTFFI